MNDQQHTLRKAAILIDSLDPPSADALLDHMDEPQADRVRQAVMELDDVSREERERIMSEFLGRQPPSQYLPQADSVAENDGVEIDRSLAERLARGDDEPETRTVAPEPKETPFGFLHGSDGTLIAQFLDNENPQTIAVVLAHLPPERAADALAHLAGDRQTDVVRRIAHLDETPAEVLRDLEAELGSRLSEQLQTMRRRTDGLAAARQIMDAVALTDRKDMLTHLAVADASLAEQLSTSPVTPSGSIRAKTADSPSAGETTLADSPPRNPPPVDDHRREPIHAPDSAPPRPKTPRITFDDLAQVSDTELAAVFARVDVDVALLALTGADQQLVQRLTKHLPARQAKQINKRLARPGPLRLSDIERAQAAVVRVAEQLAQKKEIAWPAAREGLIAAA